VALQVAPWLADHPLPVWLPSSAFRLGPEQLAAIARTSLVTSSCPADRRDRALAGLAECRPGL
jgi:hypothetical protein